MAFLPQCRGRSRVSATAATSNGGSQPGVRPQRIHRLAKQARGPGPGGQGSASADEAPLRCPTLGPGAWSRTTWPRTASPSGRRHWSGDGGIGWVVYSPRRAIDVIYTPGIREPTGPAGGTDGNV